MFCPHTVLLIIFIAHVALCVSNYNKKKDVIVLRVENTEQYNPYTHSQNTVGDSIPPFLSIRPDFTFMQKKKTYCYL